MIGMLGICDQLKPIYDDYTSSYLSEVTRAEFFDLLEQGSYKRCVPRWNDSPGASPCFLDQSFEEMEMGQCGNRFPPYNLVVLGSRGSNSYEDSPHCAALSTVLPAEMVLDEDYEGAYYFPSDQCRQQGLPILAEYIGAYGPNRYFIVEDKNQIFPYSSGLDDCGVGEQTYGGVPEDDVQGDPPVFDNEVSLAKSKAEISMWSGIAGAIIGGVALGGIANMSTKSYTTKQRTVTTIVAGAVGAATGFALGRSRQ